MVVASSSKGGLMRLTKTLALGCAALVPVASMAWAQSGQQAPTPAQLKARSNLSIMEGVLERAVVLGAESLNRRVRAVSPQDPPLLLAGEARVRGFQLDGYGVFFDVEVPVLRQSVAWSLRALVEQRGVPLAAALEQLRAYVHSVTDARARQSLEQALHRVELQVAPAAARPESAATAAAPPPSPEALAWLSDPNGVYTTAVKGAIVDAMLDHSGALGVQANEWLTVAARDNERPNRLNPRDDDLSTIMLSIKGSDLAAFRSGAITAEQARTRVLIREH